MLDNLRSGLRDAVNRIVRSNSVDTEAVLRLKKDVQRCLIISDVETTLAVEITTKLQNRAINERPPPGLSRKNHVITILYEELAELLGTEHSLPISPKRVTRILLLGIQGSGKTTTCAKLAKLLVNKGHKVGVIGADNYRPGALVQLRTMCKRARAPVYGKDSNSSQKSEDIVRDGLDHFGDSVDIVLIDTAGRHKNEQGLLDEMRRISNVAKQDVTLLVIDGTIGQQCRSQAAAFHSTVPVGGIIITKLDSSGNGGGALAAAAATGAHVMYISNGERIDDLEPFSPTRFVGRMLDMGDIQAVLSLAKKLEDADEDRNKRILRGKMTIMDFLTVLEEVRGSGLRGLLESVPMLAGNVKEKQLKQFEENADKWRCMVQSMTQVERDNPNMLNRSRVRRIARGSGYRERDVRGLIKTYNNSKSMIKGSKGRKMQSFMRRVGL